MLSTEQRSKLEHALAVHMVARDGIAWRNHYCAEAGDADMEALVALGLMRRGPTINEGRDRYYHATEAGMALCGIKGVSA